MSAKLDKSLDELMTSEKKSGGGRRGGGRGGRGGRRGGSSGGGSRSEYVNPLARGDEDDSPSSGPVRRERRQARDGPYGGGRARDGDSDGAWTHDRFDGRGAAPAAPAVAPVAARLDPGTKVLVSNLDASVGADDIKEIFQNLGNFVKAVVFYDQDRRSLGSAEVTFGNTATATRAVEEYDGAEVDGRPMTLKLLSGVTPPPRNVVVKRRERVVAPTGGPRRAKEGFFGAALEDRRDREDRGDRPRRTRGAASSSRGSRGGNSSRGTGGRRGGRGGRNSDGGRREKQTPLDGDALDKEMDAYHQARAGATATPAAAAATTAAPVAAGQPPAPAAPAAE